MIGGGQENYGSTNSRRTGDLSFQVMYLVFTFLSGSTWTQFADVNIYIK